MKKILILAMMLGVALAMSACSASFSTNANTANTNKPANAANNAASNANKANTTSNTTTNKATTEVKNEEKPKVETKKQKNTATIPADWVYYADEVRGYGFSLPAGSKSSNDNANGVDTFYAETPDKISVIVYAFKDGTLTKEDLLDRAEKALNAMGETVTVGKLTAESDDYAIADADSVSTDGEKSKLKVLVATDVTDNYVMFVRSDVASYESKKATMDAIWGSFEMYSGGASGN
ncbi:hypothetical protein BH10ACI1_BH10ACI1_24980 [soil metagenome]